MATLINENRHFFISRNQKIIQYILQFTMVFVPSVSTFYISKKLGGNTFSLIGDVIEMQFKSSNNYNLGAALSLVLMFMIIICMAVMNRFTGDDDDGGVLI